MTNFLLPPWENKMRLRYLAWSCLAGLFPLLAHAGTVDFEDVGRGTTGTFSSGGFNFSLTGDLAKVARLHCWPACPDNGTQVVAAFYGPSTLIMTAPGGRDFNLGGFDGAGSFNFNIWARPDYIPNQIDVVGVLAGGGTVSAAFLINKAGNSARALDFTTYSFGSAFAKLESASFSSSGSVLSPFYDGFCVDNIVASMAAVPEPETYAMLMAGLGLMGVVARRRKNKQA